MNRFPDSAEARDNEVIAAATSWTAFQFRGPFNRIKLLASSREDAEAAARELLTECKKPVLIYAIDPLGRQAQAATIS